MISSLFVWSSLCLVRVSARFQSTTRHPRHRYFLQYFDHVLQLTRAWALSLSHPSHICLELNNTALLNIGNLFTHVRPCTGANSCMGSLSLILLIYALNSTISTLGTSPHTLDYPFMDYMYVLQILSPHLTQDYLCSHISTYSWSQSTLIKVYRYAQMRSCVSIEVNGGMRMLTTSSLLPNVYGWGVHSYPSISVSAASPSKSSPLRSHTRTDSRSQSNPLKPSQTSPQCSSN